MGVVSETNNPQWGHNDAISRIVQGNDYTPAESEKDIEMCESH